MTNGYLDQSICGEGFGPAESLLLVEGSAADERLRHAVREVLRGQGGQSGAPNSVAYLFDLIGVLRYTATPALPRQALAAGAEAVHGTGPGELEVITAPDDLQPVRAALAAAGHVARSAGVTRRTTQGASLDPAQAARLAALVDALRGVDGVVQVYTNVSAPDAPGTSRPAPEDPA